MFWRFKVKLIKESIKKMSDVELLVAYEVGKITMQHINIWRKLLGKGKNSNKLERTYHKMEKAAAILLKELRFIIKRRGLEHEIIKGGG